MAAEYQPVPIRDRLPTLFEVLSRRTTAPVDLHYVRELRRSVLVETPELEKAGSKRSSQVLENLQDIRDAAGPSNFSEQRSQDARLSAFLRSESGSKHSPSNSHGSQGSGTTTGTELPPRPSFMTGNSNSPAQASQSPAHTVARADIRASAEKILYTYLLPGAEREIILPQSILDDIVQAVERQGRDDPEVFDPAKDYVFQAMERDAFPGFLRAKALGNIVPPSMMLRLILGMLSLFGAFWAAFLILPFTLGVYLLASHQYMLDPLAALAGLSEYTFFDFYRIREPFVRRLLSKRALMCLGWITAIDAALLCLFIFVPGKRL
ncbi:MAG: hypothetical protein Q9165_006905 [Trypethelium subeluteriae]